MEGKQAIPMKRKDFGPAAGSKGVSPGVEGGVYSVEQVTELCECQVVKGADEKPVGASGSTGVSRNGKTFEWG